jgi:hypothetical protein
MYRHQRVYKRTGGAAQALEAKLKRLDQEQGSRRIPLCMKLLCYLFSHTWSDNSDYCQRCKVKKQHTRGDSTGRRVASLFL